MADAGDSKSPALTGMWVRLPPPAPHDLSGDAGRASGFLRRAAAFVGKDVTKLLLPVGVVAGEGGQTAGETRRAGHLGRRGRGCRTGELAGGPGDHRHAPPR